jgi:hypothetical protein
VANKWLEALKSKNTPHNTEEDCAREDGRSSKAGGKNGRTREKPPVKTAKTPSNNGHTPENVPAKTNRTPTKQVKKKLTPEEEATHYDELATAFPEYVHTAIRAGEVLEWVARRP